MGIKIKKPKLPEPSKVVKEWQNKVKSCAKGIKLPDIKKIAQHKADALAVAYQNTQGDGGDFEDCVVVVAAGCAALGAAEGGVIGAALGAGGGVPLARISCRRVFPQK
ncbi:MAG: hypothetical protein ABSE63_18925 [Thermoguttaceae bacterium]|jgi:hypothetical protein